MRTKSYSLIELMVVVGVITVVGLMSIPNIFNRNDRLSLNTSASQIRQLIIDARTRSLAPDKNDLSGSTQQYQVVFGTFTDGSDPETVKAIGGGSTNTVTLERGLARCDSGDPQGGFSTLRSYKLPRGLYVSSFYPSNQPSTDNQAIIRYTVGQEGFVCGGSDNPNFRSGLISQSGWSGKNEANGTTTARYLTIEVSSQKIAEKRYINLDRMTGEVVIARTDSQSYFTPKADTLAPKWKNSVVDTFPDDIKLSVDCGASSSDITVSYNRALDRIDDVGSEGDANLYVAYDISWNTGAGIKPLEVGYFYNLAEDIVRYSFTTDSFSSANQPTSVIVYVAAKDGIGLSQPAYAPLSPNERLNQRQKAFTLSCGNVSAEEKSGPPGDVPAEINPNGESESCNPIILQKPHGIKKVFSWFIGRVYAIGEGPPLIIPLC